MNFGTLIKKVDSFVNKGELSDARVLIKENLERLRGPEKQKYLSVSALNLLTEVLKEVEQDQENQKEISDQAQGPSLKMRKKQAEEDEIDQKNNYIIQQINEYARDLNWKRARTLVVRNANLLKIEKYRKKLNADAIILVKAIESSQKK